MENERITTIIKEIEYWKEHKLLDSQQCDFLLAIYTNGEGNQEKIKQQALRQSSVITMLQLILLFLLLPFSFLILYFTELHVYLQLGILGLFLIYAIWNLLAFRKLKNKYYQPSLIISIFLLLLFSVQLAHLIFNQSIALVVVIILTFIFWFILGRLENIKYLMITSVFGLIFVINYLFLYN